MADEMPRQGEKPIAGDIVMLKSGGPKMTVAKVVERGNLECLWFVGLEVRSFIFSPEALEKTTADRMVSDGRGGFQPA